MPTPATYAARLRARMKGETLSSPTGFTRAETSYRRRKAASEKTVVSKRAIAPKVITSQSAKVTVSRSGPTQWWGKKMARIRVGKNQVTSQYVYAGITYFYKIRRGDALYQKIERLINSGVLSSDKIITPDRLRRLVGKPFDTRYGIAYAKKYM